MSSPKSTQLAVELRNALRAGLNTPSLREASGLLSLAVVSDQSASPELDDLCASALRVVKQAIREVDGVQDGAAATTFGVATGTRGSLQRERRRQAAALRHVSTEHFRKYVEASLVAEVADQVHYIDSLYRLRRSRDEFGEREATDSHLGINWLERHEAYGRIWTPVYALRADLLAAETLRRTDPEAPVYGLYIHSSLWWYARVMFEVARFTERFGGLWLFTDPDDETAVMEAMYGIDFHTSLSQQDTSRLRLLVANSPNQELDAFTALLEADSEGDSLIAGWRQWVESCDCADLDKPDRDCAVHQVTSACETYTDIVDEDWQRLGDWYRVPTENFHGRDVTELWKQFGGLEKKSR